MAFELKGHWATAIAVVATGAGLAGIYFLDEHLKNTAPEYPGACKDTFYAQGRDCLAKDVDGNPISIAIDTPATPKL